MFVLDENAKPDIKVEPPVCQGILVSVPAFILLFTENYYSHLVR